MSNHLTADRTHTARREAADASHVDARPTRDDASRRGLSAEARAMDIHALSRALMATSRHDESCAHCNAPALSADVQAARMLRGSAHSPACLCAGCELRANMVKQRQMECPGIDPGELDRLVKEAIDKLAQGDEAAPEGGAAPGGGGGAAPGGGAAQQSTLAADVDEKLQAEIDQKVQAFTAGFLGHDDDLHAGSVAWAKPPGFPGTLGLTTPPWNASGGTYTYPNLDFDIVNATVAPGAAGPSAFIAKIKATTSGDATHPCVASPAGNHNIGTVNVPNGSGGNVAFDIIFQINAAFANQIRDAEQEHLDDLLLAYQLSLEAAATAVNALAGTTYTGATDAAARAAGQAAVAGRLHAKLTGNPATWRTVVMSLGRLSGSQRDALGYHSFGADKPVADVPGRKINIKINAGTTQIGSHTPASVVTFASI